MKNLFLINYILALTYAMSLNAMTIVRHRPPVGGENDTRDNYYVRLLKLCLEKSIPKYGPYQLKMISKHMTQPRELQSLTDGKYIDVMWTMTSKEREQALTPIRVPLTKGLLGHRILLIRSTDKGKFLNIKNLNDLKQYIAGQGADWPDTKILKASGIKVVTPHLFDGFFKMLSAGRFDFFPRGVTEVWDEYMTHKNLGIIIDSQILIRYKSPTYFFVNKNNSHLEKRIQYGLNFLLKDGSFNNYFYNYSLFKEIIGKLSLKKRVILDLPNPDLPSKTPIGNKGLWLDISK